MRNLKRREFLKRAALGAAGAVQLAQGLTADAAQTLRAPERKAGATPMPSGKTFDAVVIGAGVFGAWIAYHLARAGKSVALLDAYGPANARASSAGESRIIRMGYGPDELYTSWSVRALALWKSFFADSNQPLFHRTGVLWLARDTDTYSRQTVETLARLRVPHEQLTKKDLESRFPQFNFDGVDWGLLETQSGALMARRAVQAVVAAAVKAGAEYHALAVARPAGKGRLDAVQAGDGRRFSAGVFVFACGPWLGKIFPSLLGERIFPSRQEVFFFGVPPGDSRFAPPAMPAWIYLADEVYGLPDLESRGLKIAPDRHGERVDPDTQSRVVSPEITAQVRQYVARRFPALGDAPIVETRVCQYENTSNGDFLIDRHPEMENVWLVGGGSGHGFKHGPSLGEYVASRVLEGGAVEPRFSLAAKQTLQKRAVF